MTPLQQACWRLNYLNVLNHVHTIISYSLMPPQSRATVSAAALSLHSLQGHRLRPSTSVFLTAPKARMRRSPLDRSGVTADIGHGGCTRATAASGSCLQVSWGTTPSAHTQ